MCNDAGELVGGVCAYCNGIVGVSGGFSVAVATPDLGVEGAVEHQLHNGQVMITLDDVPCDLSECPKPDGRTTNDCDAYLAAHDLPKLGVHSHQPSGTFRHSLGAMEQINHDKIPQT